MHAVIAYNKLFSDKNPYQPNSRNACEFFGCFVVVKSNYGRNVWGCKLASFENREITGFVV